MFPGNIYSKILNTGTILTLSGVFLGAIFITPSWGMDPPDKRGSDKRRSDKRKSDKKKSTFKQLKSTLKPESKSRSKSRPEPVKYQKLINSKREAKSDLERISNPHLSHDHTHRSLSDDRIYESLKIDIPPDENVNDLPIPFMIKTYSHITTLSLSGVTLGGPGVGDSRMTELISILSNKPLKKLKFNNCGVTDAGAKLIASLSDSPLGDTLEELDLGHNKIGDSGVTAFEETLKINHTLKILDLSYNEISDRSAATLGKLLKANSSLENVNLKNNRITGQGVLDFFSSLTERPNNPQYSTLTLNMGDNSLELQESLNSYRLLVILTNPSSDDLSQIKSGDLGLFCEDNRLYCKTYDRKKMQIEKSDHFKNGFDVDSFDRIFSIMNDSGVKGQQESETLSPFERITKGDEEKLLQYTSRIGYTPLVDSLAQKREELIDKLKDIRVMVNFTLSPRPFIEIDNDDSN